MHPPKYDDYFTRLELNYSTRMLVEESLMVHYQPFESGKKVGSWFDHAPTWLIGKVNDSRLCIEIHRLKKLIENKTGTKDAKPRFYVQAKGSEVPWHTDLNTRCCINIILSNRAAPIVFEDIGEVQYRCALFDITKRHMVPEFKTERLLLKFSIFDVSYEDAREGLKDYVSSH